MVLGMFPAAFADDGIELARDDTYGAPENADSITNDDEAANPSDDSVGADALIGPETSDNSAEDDATQEEQEQMIAEEFSNTDRFEAELVASGISGMLGWTLDRNGLLTISGEGQMNDFTIASNADWLAYRDSIKRVWISDATSIGKLSFQYCQNLAEIHIPDSVTSIGDHAFWYCSGLTSVTIPDSVTSIGNNAFIYCSGLTSVTIPDSVTSIGSLAFNDCTSLTSVTIPNRVTSISSAAFAGCSGLTSVTIPDSVTSIGYRAFQKCSGLTSMTIPSSVTSIGNCAFQSCSSLTDVYYGGTKEEWDAITVGDYNEPLTDATIHYESSPVITYTVTFDANGGSVSPASLSAARTTSYTFKNWNTAANGSGTSYNPGASYSTDANVTLYAQWNSSTGTAAVTLPTPTRSGFIFKGWATSSGAASGFTGSYTPSGNVTLYAVWAGPDFVLPAALTTIDAEAFTGGAFSYVKLSDKTTSIGARAFADCPNLRYVYIPEATTGIAGDAFSGVDGLTILGKSGSYAEFFAQKNGYAFDATE